MYMLLAITSVDRAGNEFAEHFEIEVLDRNLGGGVVAGQASSTRCTSPPRVAVSSLRQLA
jgi:hypothetical protein